MEQLARVSENGMKTVLKGKEWSNYCIVNGLSSKDQMELYKCTHNHTPIYKIGVYYFSFKFQRGYANLASLKRLV